MTSLLKMIEHWTSRQKPVQSYTSLHEFPVSLGSHIGAIREENQDRILAGTLWQQNRGKTVFVAVLCDGMGGMMNGALAASISASAFLEAAINSNVRDTRRRLLEACQYANRKVNERLRAKGGSTLTATYIDSEHRTWTANIGDSRSYGMFNEFEVVRLTKDDSLAEVVGGERRDLLQFVGMGQGIEPAVKELAPDIRRIVLTSDGAHFFDNDVLSTLIRNSEDPEMCVRRITALSQWLGGPDNSTVGCIDVFRLKEILRNTSTSLDRSLQIWDEASTCHFALNAEPMGSVTASKDDYLQDGSPEKVLAESPHAHGNRSTSNATRKKSTQSNIEKAPSAKQNPREQIELKIVVENGRDENSE